MSDAEAMPANAPNTVKLRVKREFRNPPSMNIPPEFFVLAVPALIAVLIYIVGIILNDISREDQESVEENFGTLN